MGTKDFFALGSKLLGVYCFASAIQELFNASPAEIAQAAELVETAVIFKIPGWLTSARAAILTLLGFYLIRDSSYVHDLAFRQDEDEWAISPKHFFVLGVKLYGVYLIVSSVPGVLTIISNGLQVLGAAPYLSTDMEMDGIKSNLLATVYELSLGFYFLVRGRDLIRLAYPRPDLVLR